MGRGAGSDDTGVVVADRIGLAISGGLAGTDALEAVAPCDFLAVAVGLAGLQADLAVGVERKAGEGRIAACPVDAGASGLSRGDPARREATATADRRRTDERLLARSRIARRAVAAALRFCTNSVLAKMTLGALRVEGAREKAAAIDREALA